MLSWTKLKSNSFLVFSKNISSLFPSNQFVRLKTPYESTAFYRIKRGISPALVSHHTLIQSQILFRHIWFCIMIFNFSWDVLYPSFWMFVSSSPLFSMRSKYIECMSSSFPANRLLTEQMIPQLLQRKHKPKDHLSDCCFACLACQFRWTAMFC